MMFLSIFTPFIPYVLLLIAGALIFANGLAKQLKTRIETQVISFLQKTTTQIFQILRDVWSFKDIQNRETALRPEKVDEIYERKHHKDPSFTKADAEKYVRQPQPPTQDEIFTAWTRRFFYLIFGLVVISADLVIVAARLGPIVFGGNISDFLVPLVKYLTAIASALFVTLGLLSGALIQEYSGKLPFAVQLHPEFDAHTRLVFRSLAIAVLGITIGSGVVLAYFAAVLANTGAGIGTNTLAGIFIGITIGVILAAFLAFEGILKAFIGLVSLIVLVPLGLLSGAITLFMWLPALVLDFFAFINDILLKIWRAFSAIINGVKPIETFPQDISLIGFGNGGSDFVLKTSAEVQRLYEGSGKPILFNSNVYSGIDDQTRNQLNAMGIYAQGVFPLNANIPDHIEGLWKGYAASFGSNTQAEKTLIWVADGLDMGKCIQGLKDLQASGIQHLKVFLIWLVPQGITPEVKLVAQDIKSWFNEAGSILMSTLVIMDDSPLVNETAGIVSTLVGRSLAGIIGAPFGSGQGAKFAHLITLLHDGRKLFVGISSSSIGVPARKQRNTYHLDSGIASTNLMNIVAEQIDQQTLNSTTDTWHPQHTMTFTNFIVPTGAVEVGLPTLVNQWLQAKFRIIPNTVSYVEANAIDRGISPNVPKIFARYVGDVYLQTTIVYGLSDIPKDLQ